MITWRVFGRDELIGIMQKTGMKLAHECYNFDLNQQGSWQPQLNHKRLVTIWEKE